MFDLWKGGGFGLRRILIFFLMLNPFVNLLGVFLKSFWVFLKSFWGYFLTIICRVLSALHLV
jgi:hypothetical protein